MQALIHRARMNCILSSIKKKNVPQFQVIHIRSAIVLLALCLAFLGMLTCVLQVVIEESQLSRGGSLQQKFKLKIILLQAKATLES